MQFNPKVPNAKLAVYEVYEISSIFLEYLLTCGLQSTCIAIVDNTPLLRVFNAECYIPQPTYDLSLSIRAHNQFGKPSLSII